MESADSFNIWGGSLCWGDESFPAPVPSQGVNQALETRPGSGANSSSCSPGSTLSAPHAELQAAAVVSGRQAAFGLPADGTAAPEAELGSREQPAAVLSTQDILDHEASVDYGMVAQQACNWVGQDSSSFGSNTDSANSDEARPILIGSCGPPRSSMDLVSGGWDGLAMPLVSEGSSHQASAPSQDEEKEEAVPHASEGNLHVRADQAPALRKEEKADAAPHASEGSSHVRSDQAPAPRLEQEEEATMHALEGSSHVRSHQIPAPRQEQEEEQLEKEAVPHALEGSSHVQSAQAPTQRQQEEAMMHALEGSSALRYEGAPAVCQESSVTLRCDEAPACRQEEATLQYEAPAHHLEEATFQCDRPDAMPQLGAAGQDSGRTGAARTNCSPHGDGTLPYEATNKPAFMKALERCGLGSHGQIYEQKGTPDQPRTAVVDNETIEYESLNEMGPLRQTVTHGDTIEYKAWNATDQVRQTVMNSDTFEYEAWNATDQLRRTVKNNDTIEYEAWNATDQLRQTVMNNDTIEYEAWNATDQPRRSVMRNDNIGYEAGNLRLNAGARSPVSPQACAVTPPCLITGTPHRQHDEQSQQHWKNTSRPQIGSKDLGAKYATPQKIHRSRDTDENEKPGPQTVHAACATEVSGQHLSASTSWLVPVKRRRLEQIESGGARTASLRPRTKVKGMLAAKQESLGETAGCGTGAHKTQAATRGRDHSSQSSTSLRAARQLTLTEAWRDTKRIASVPVVIHDSLCIDGQ